ncbi:MAG: pseudouridine synthase [Candidatus Nomurabacteria bacterium]|jgi:23S rRNA pseudouridine2605 synthase|nr:pseudouridine synthase [Candidatus Nomurabacteria bacterium]
MPSSDNHQQRPHQPPRQQRQPYKSTLRLNKTLALYLGVSRREADDMIAASRVQVDGKTATLGERISPTSVIYVDSKEIKPTKYLTYLALNKPVGYISSRARQDSTPTIYELLPKEYKHLKTAGRLDKDSSGLMLLSNDGDWVLKMTHPKYEKVKIYEVELDKPLEPLHQQMIADFGVNLPDGRSQLGLTALGSKRKWQVTMYEGRNRQIRRTFGALGYTVTKLHRTQLDAYQLGALQPGEWQEIKSATKH